MCTVPSMVLQRATLIATLIATTMVANNSSMNTPLRLTTRLRTTSPSPTPFLMECMSLSFSLVSASYEWINSYIFISPEFLSDGDPTDWTLSGSLDKSSWDTLDLQSQFSFNNRFQVVTFNLPSNGKVYKHFKFEFSIFYYFLLML